jgi:hypothetical protein
MSKTKRVPIAAAAPDVPTPIRMAALSMFMNALGWTAHTTMIGGSSLAGFALLTGIVAFVGLVALACSLRAAAEMRRMDVEPVLRPLVGLSLVVAAGTLIAAAVLFSSIVVVLIRAGN